MVDFTASHNKIGVRAVIFWLAADAGTQRAIDHVLGSDPIFDPNFVRSSITALTPISDHDFGPPLKFHLQAPAANVITGFGDGWIRIGADEYHEGVVILPDRVVTGWAPAGFDALAAEDFAGLLASGPEIVLLGTGRRHRFPHPRLVASLIEARTGIEAMDTGAACRTFNILVAEGRRVVAALAIEPA